MKRVSIKIVFKMRISATRYRLFGALKRIFVLTASYWLSPDQMLIFVSRDIQNFTGRAFEETTGLRKCFCGGKLMPRFGSAVTCLGVIPQGKRSFYLPVIWLSPVYV